MDQRASPYASLILLAVLATIINALKPIHIDDTYYFWVAEQIVRDPFDPFGFVIHWQQWPMNAYDNYVPPLLPYWLALSMTVFGDDPFFWKLGQLPFILLFVITIHSLGSKFLPKLAMPFTFFLTLSPAILPGWNLMLDVPAISLGIAAIALSIRAVDHQNWKYALAASCIASMAVLLKFTALVIPGVILLYSLIHRRFYYGFGIGLFVLAVIIVWEYLHYALYGHTQLLWGLLQDNQKNGNFGSINELLIAAWLTLGGLFILLTSVFLSSRSNTENFFYSAFVSILFVASVYSLAIFSDGLETGFSVLGCVLFLAIVSSCFVSGEGKKKFGIRLTTDPAYMFLIGWLVLEIIAYFLISPFPATRRIISLGIVLTFLGFRLLNERITGSSERSVLAGCWILVAGNFSLAMLYFVVDYKEADAQKILAADAVQQHQQQRAGEGTIWYAGHWGFAYYAEAQGMKAIIPDSSVFKAGDWLVRPERISAPFLQIDPETMTVIGYLELTDNIPLQTLPAFYAGRKPLEAKHESTRLRAYIYQSNHDQIIQSAYLEP